MESTGNRAVERAEEMVVLERDQAVAEIRQSLSVSGAAECTDCGEAIAVARRKAIPSARRCFECQERHELAGKRGW